MQASPSATEVRRMVVGVFNDFCRIPIDPNELDERIRIEGSQLVARSYRVSGLFAIWLVSVGLVQFYDDPGNMLRTVNLLRSATFDRAAA